MQGACFWCRNRYRIPVDKFSSHSSSGGISFARNWQSSIYLRQRSANSFALAHAVSTSAIGRVHKSEIDKGLITITTTTYVNSVTTWANWAICVPQIRYPDCSYGNGLLNLNLTNNTTCNMNWVNLIWLKLNWVELNWFEAHWIELFWLELNYTVLLAMAWIELSWVDLVWLDLRWIEFS